MRSGHLFLGATTIPLVASSASNWADLELPVQLPQAVWSWSGGYVGGHLGGGYGRTSFSNLYGLPVYGDLVDTPGGQIGYNWQKNSWIFGVELEASGAVSDNTNTCLAACGNIVSANCKAGPDVFATGAGRVGYAFGPQSHALAYIKRGLSWQSNQAEVVNNNEFGVWHRRKSILPKIVSAASSVWASSRRLRLHGPSRWSMTTCISAGRGSIRLRPCSFHPFAILPASTRTRPARVTSQRKGRIIILAPSRGRRNGGDVLLHSKAFDTVPPIAYTAGWSYGGSRHWLSRGRFQRNRNAVPYVVALKTRAVSCHGSRTTDRTEFPGNYSAPFDSPGEYS